MDVPAAVKETVPNVMAAIVAMMRSSCKIVTPFMVLEFQQGWWSPFTPISMRDKHQSRNANNEREYGDKRVESQS